MADDKDAKLVAALKLSKTTPMFFAFVAKGSTDGVLLLEKKSVPASVVNKAKTESGGKQVYRGRCVWEGTKLICDVAKEPPATLAKQMKAVIKESADQTLAVEFRIVTDLPDEGDETQGTIPPAPPQPTPVPAPPVQEAPPASVAPLSEDAARFAARLKALAPEVQKAEAAGSPHTKEIKLHISEANALFRGKQLDEAHAALDKAEALLKPASTGDAAARFATRLKALAPVMQKAETTGSPLLAQAKTHIADANKLYVAKQYDQAHEGLDKAEAVIKQVFAGTAPKEDPLAAAWEKKLAEIEPLYRDAQTRRLGDVSKMKVLFMFAQEQADKGQYAAGVQALGQIEKLLEKAQQGEQQPDEVIPEGLVKYRQALLQFNKDLSSIVVDLSKLQTGIVDNDPDEAEMADELIEYLTVMHSDLSDFIDDAINAAQNVREPYNNETRKEIQTYLQEIRDDELIQHVDKNPYVTIKLTDTLTSGLVNIEKTMV